MKGGVEVHRGRQDYLHDVSSRHPEMRKLKQDAYAWKKKKTDSKFSEENLVPSNSLCKLNRFKNDGSFMEEVIRQQSGFCTETESECKAAAAPLKIIEDGKEDLVVMQGLSANQLAPKALQLRLKGKHEDAEKWLVFFSNNLMTRTKGLHKALMHSQACVESQSHPKIDVGSGNTSLQGEPIIIAGVPSCMDSDLQGGRINRAGPCGARVPGSN